MRRAESIASDWFEALYQGDPDPWDFESSPYEAAKYARTLAALPRARYAQTLEVGCSVGVLTRRLAERCERVTGLDVSASALARATDRCRDLPQVALLQRRLPDEGVEGIFDLLVLSEVVYYLDRADVARLAERLWDAWAPGGDAVLVHWTGETDYPLTGDAAVEALSACWDGRVEVLLTERPPSYRLDVWRRSG